MPASHSSQMDAPHIGAVTKPMPAHPNACLSTSIFYPLIIYF